MAITSSLLKAIPGVELRELIRRDAVAYFGLVSRNREHLTEYGDYEDLAASTLEDIDAYFTDPPDSNVRMDIWRKDELMGGVDLSPVAPKTLVLGYWIGAEYTGRGYVTAACRALMDYAQHSLDATEFWAGIKPANQKSAAVAERLSFSVFEKLPTHTRYRFTRS